MTAGRFTLASEDDVESGQLGYITSWDTWEEAAAAFCLLGRIPYGYRLVDNETGRVWHSGARYGWEEASA